MLQSTSRKVYIAFAGRCRSHHFRLRPTQATAIWPAKVAREQETSMATVQKYVDETAIANQGMDEDEE